MSDIAPRPHSARWTVLLGLGPALLFVGLALPALHENSATYDETEHVPAGYTYLTRGDYRLGPEHPPLVKQLTALALLGQSPTISPAAERAFEAARRDIDAHWIFGYRFLFTDNAPGPLLWRARVVVVALGAILVFAIFQWTRQAFGTAGALLAATAAALDPNLLAHGTLATTDLGFTLFFLLAIYGTHRTFGRLTVPAALATGAAIAAAFAAKHSAVLLIPGVALLSALRIASRAPWPSGAPARARGADGRASQFGPGRRLVLVLGLLTLWSLIAWGGLWATYGFRYAAAADGQTTLPIATWATRIREIGITRAHLEDGTPIPHPAVISEQAARLEPGLTERALLAAHEYRLVPEGYTFGLTFAAAMAQVRRAFLLGEISLTGWTSYFPFAFAVKTPLGTLALLALAFGLGIVALAGRRSADGADSMFVAEPATGSADPPDPRSATGSIAGAVLVAIVAPPLIVMGAAMSSNLNIGYRHILPALPFLYVLVGIVPSVLARVAGRRVAFGVCAGALILLAVETLGARPYYIPFFNTAAGGARGGLHLLSDSNLDWGQGLPALKRWMQSNQVPRVNLAYFGTADPAAYGVSFVPIAGTYRMAVPGGGSIGYAPRPPELPGWIAISATHLQGTYLLPSENRAYDSLRTRDPDAIVANSIYLYWVERGNE